MSGWIADRLALSCKSRSSSAVRNSSEETSVMSLKPRRSSTRAVSELSGPMLVSVLAPASRNVSDVRPASGVRSVNWCPRMLSSVSDVRPAQRAQVGHRAEPHLQVLERGQIGQRADIGHGALADVEPGEQRQAADRGQIRKRVEVEVQIHEACQILHTGEVVQPRRAGVEGVQGGDQAAREVLQGPDPERTPHEELQIDVLERGDGGVGEVRAQLIGLKHLTLVDQNRERLLGRLPVPAADLYREVERARRRGCARDGAGRGRQRERGGEASGDHGPRVRATAARRADRL